MHNNSKKLAKTTVYEITRNKYEYFGPYIFNICFIFSGMDCSKWKSGFLAPPSKIGLVRNGFGKSGSRTGSLFIAGFTSTNGGNVSLSFWPVGRKTGTDGLIVAGRTAFDPALGAVLDESVRPRPGLSFEVIP